MIDATFHAYVLRSESTGRFYIGSGQNLTRRLEEHNRCQTTSTRGRGPWVLFWDRSFLNRAEAVQYERYLKSLKSRVAIEQLARLTERPD